MTTNGKAVNLTTARLPCGCVNHDGGPYSERCARADYGPGHPFTGAPIVSSYSRASAIADGFLVDVTGPAKAEGFRWPVAISRGAYAATIPEPEHLAYSVLSELLHLACTIIQLRKPVSDRVHFAFTSKRHPAAPVRLYIHAGPGDRGEPVLTIMREGED